MDIMLPQAVGPILCWLSMLTHGYNAEIDGEWELVYKVATGGISNIIGMQWTNNESANIDNVDAQSLTEQKGQFKSDIINHWEEAGIEQVKVSVYRYNQEQAYFIFNATNTNRTNWFDKAQVISSSYSSFNRIDPLNHETVLMLDGYTLPNQDNTMFWDTGGSFYIGHDSSTITDCLNVKGWLLIVTREYYDNCNSPGIKNIQYIHENVVLFSPHDDHYPLFDASREESTADFMAIFVKFETHTCDHLPVCSHPIQLDASRYCFKPCIEAPTNRENTTEAVFTSLFNESTTLKTASTTSATESNKFATESTIIDVESTTLSAESTTLVTTIGTKNTSKTILTPELVEKIQTLQTILEVPAKATHKYQRTLISASDDRTSSATMGILGGAVIMVVIGSIVVLDILTFFRAKSTNVITGEKRKVRN